MARDATLTRSLLLRAGERRFARDGVSGARMSDVVRAAGQANDSAVGYHFGSRQGLLQAIITKHVQAMEDQRVVAPRSAGVRGQVEVILRPTADLLVTEDGRDFLRIVEQLADWSGLGSGPQAPPLQGTVLRAQLDALTLRLDERVGSALARERVALFVTFVAGALAARARAIETTERQRISHERFVDHLADVLTGGLLARARLRGPRATQSGDSPT